MKKKLMAMALSLTMVAGILAGCGGSSSTGSSAEVTNENHETASQAVETSTTAADTGLTPEEQEAVYIMRKALNGMKPEEAVDNILNMFSRTANNAEFVEMVKKNKFL